MTLGTLLHGGQTSDPVNFLTRRTVDTLEMSAYILSGSYVLAQLNAQFPPAAFVHHGQFQLLAAATATGAGLRNPEIAPFALATIEIPLREGFPA